MRLTESNFKEQLRSTDIVVPTEVTIYEFYNCGDDRDYIRIDARSIDSRAGYVDVELDEYYGNCISVHGLYFDPNEMHYYSDPNIPHLDTTFIPELAEAKKLVELKKEHTLIFDNLFMHLELTYKPKYDVYVIKLTEKIPGIRRALYNATRPKYDYFPIPKDTVLLPDGTYTDKKNIFCEQNIIRK